MQASHFLLQLSLMFPCLLFPLSLQTELVCFDACFACKQRHPKSHIYYILPVPSGFSILGISFHRLPLLHRVCLPFYLLNLSAILFSNQFCFESNLNMPSVGFLFFSGFLVNLIPFSKIRKYFLKTSVN